MNEEGNIIMLKRIHHWFIAIKLCFKHNVGWWPFGNGRALINARGDGQIQVSPFRHCFLAVFCHELGHIRDSRKRGFYKFFSKATVETELYANIFSAKLLGKLGQKTDEDIFVLRNYSFYSYTRDIPTKVEKAIAKPVIERKGESTNLSVTMEVCSHVSYDKMIEWVQKGNRIK